MILVTRQYECGWGLMVSVDGGWTCGLLNVVDVRNMFTANLHISILSYHTHISPPSHYPACLPFCLLWEKQGRREDLHSDDREDGLVGAFTRLLRINNSNNKCKLIILVPLPSSSLALPRLGYFVEFLCGELYVQEQVHGNNNNKNDI